MGGRRDSRALIRTSLFLSRTTDRCVMFRHIVGITREDMRSDLELFVLALVQQGLATKYDLRERAGVSLGSTSPVLGRLEKDGLIRASEEGARRSRRFAITTKGANLLTQEWASHLLERPNDIDSILRVVYLAWMNGDTQGSVSFMKRSAEALRGLASSRRAEADRLALRTDEIPDGDAFRWLRTHCEAARLQAESDALLDIRERINKKNGKTKKKAIQRTRRR